MTTRLGLRRVGRAVVTGSGRLSPAPSGDLIHQSARGGWGLVATRTTRSSHRPSSPRTQGPWGRTRFRVLDAEVTAQSLDEAELVATTGPTNREVRRHDPAATPRRFALYVSLLRPHRIAFLNPSFRESEPPCEPSQRSASDPIRLVRIGEAGRRLRRSVEQRVRPHPACLDR